MQYYPQAPALPAAGSNVQYVLQVDVSDTVLARDPFQLFASQASQHDLWVNVQKNTEWTQKNYQASRCCGASSRSLGIA